MTQPDLDSRSSVSLVSSFVALAAFVALAFAPTDSRAQDVCPELRDGCHSDDVSFHYREGLFDDLSFDTGWVPSGSPLQVRFEVYVGGGTEVDLAGRASAWWPAPISVAVTGAPETGRLAINYGLEIRARIRFDVEVAGVRYRWEGDIPTGSIPTDLRMAAEATFDSFLLPPSEPRPAMVLDATDAIDVVPTDVGRLVDIPGLRAGFSATIQGQLGATWATERLEIGDAARPIDTEGGETIATADEGASDFGAAKDVVITPVGMLGYEGSLVFLPALYVEVAGRRFDLGPGPIELPLVDLDREITMDSATMHVPLPDLALASRDVDFGVVRLGDSATELLNIQNMGEAPLTVTPRMAAMPFGVEVSSLTIPPRSSRALELRFAPDRAGPAMAMLFLDSDDPDESLVVVRLLGEGEAESVAADGGVGDAGPSSGASSGGCACRASAAQGRSAAPALLGLVMLAGVWLRRRARR